MKEAHKLQDITAIDTAVAEMNTAWTAASEELYKATQAGGAGPEAHENNGSGGQANGSQDHEQGQQNAENVTDAEFEEVK